MSRDEGQGQQQKERSKHDPQTNGWKELPHHLCMLKVLYIWAILTSTLLWWSVSIMQQLAFKKGSCVNPNWLCPWMSIVDLTDWLIPHKLDIVTLCSLEFVQVPAYTVICKLHTYKDGSGKKHTCQKMMNINRPNEQTVLLRLRAWCLHGDLLFRVNCKLTSSRTRETGHQ